MHLAKRLTKPIPPRYFTAVRTGQQPQVLQLFGTDCPAQTRIVLPRNNIRPISAAKPTHNISPKSLKNVITFPCGNGNTRNQSNNRLPDMLRQVRLTGYDLLEIVRDLREGIFRQCPDMHRIVHRLMCGGTVGSTANIFVFKKLRRFLRI